MATLAIKPSHPALLARGITTPPLTPTSPLTARPFAPTPPVHSYAQLRAHHATALKYVIAKLRWEQANSGYLRGEDAWANHNMMIAKLEKELTQVEAAQKGLDRFPDCYAVWATPEPHGPLSKEQVDAKKAAEAKELKEANDKLDAHFPFIKQLFIGPRTKQQARHDKLLREMLLENDFDELQLLLPSENLRMLEEGYVRKAPGGGQKKTYEQQRQEKEKAKIAAQFDTPKKVVTPEQPRPQFGPMTHEQYLATLPVFGPKTLEEYLLPIQREQRHVILTWLRKPWPTFDQEAADLMEKLGRLALKKMDFEVKSTKATKV